MTTRILYFTLIVLLASCAPESNTPTGELPSDVATLKQMRTEVRSELEALESRLSEIDGKLQEVSPVMVKAAALVTTLHVRKADFEHFVAMQASVQSDEIVRLGSEAAGRIVSLNVEEGQNVKKGQLIAKLDLDVLNKQLAELQTSLSLANDVYDRQQRLWDQKIGSEMQYLQAKNNKERLEKSIDVLKTQISKANVYAPSAGVVERLFMEEGELASPGMPIVEIVNTNKLKVVADLPENYLKSVKRGDAVDIFFPALGDSVQGRVNLIGRTIDPSNRTFKVEVGVRNNGYLKPNLLASMKINDFTEKDVVTIRPDLLQQEVGGKKFVFLVREDNGEYFAKKQYIETGASGEKAIVVTTGLKPGDILIDKGGRGLTDGDPIELTSKNDENNG